MTKEEAIAAMREGKKVKHMYFEDYEWMKLSPDGLYQFEDGSMIDSSLFWEDRKDNESWNVEWEVFKNQQNKGK